ncbi:CAAX protease family protein [Mycolicibacterium duvalii]|uniref:CAAX protease family protein n=1 Tax=Mycolicibacterium duvalii TaxID=39688 RepID=A0A7I7K9Q4_9MYCO|nr:CAAX protease family protein [Mycolicibacterium duvalii]
MLRALALSATLLTWSALAARIPARWHPIPHAAVGAALAAATPASLGLRPPRLWAGLRWGGAVSVPLVLGIAASTANRRVRSGMAERDLPAAPGRWLLLRIPLGTVWSEEVAYRAALGSAANRAFGPRAGRLLTALVFGLSHVPDARAAGESVAGTVALTGAAGWLFSWLHTESGSVAAPMLTHLAVNEAGAVAALVVARRRLKS